MLSENLKSKIANAGWNIYSENNHIILTKRLKNYAEIRLYKNEEYHLSYKVVGKDFVELFEKKFDEFPIARRSLERMVFGKVHSLLEK